MLQEVLDELHVPSIGGRPEDCAVMPPVIPIVHVRTGIDEATHDRCVPCYRCSQESGCFHIATHIHASRQLYQKLHGSLLPLVGGQLQGT